MPQLYWIVPLEPGHASNELPGGPPPHVGGGPIYHPGHPSHGLPSYGHPGGGPIYHPGHPDHGLPSAPAYPTGQPVPPGEISNELPEPPPPYDEKVVVAVKRPGAEWKVTAYDAGTFPNQGLPEGGAQPK